MQVITIDTVSYDSSEAQSKMLHHGGLGNLWQSMKIRFVIIPQTKVVVFATTLKVIVDWDSKRISLISYPQFIFGRRYVDLENHSQDNISKNCGIIKTLFWNHFNCENCFIPPKLNELSHFEQVEGRKPLRTVLYIGNLFENVRIAVFVRYNFHNSSY